MYPISFVSFSVSLPGVPGPTSLPLPWRVRYDGLMGDGLNWFLLVSRVYVLSTSILSSLCNFLWVVAWSFSRVLCWIPCLSTSGVGFCAGIC